MALKASGLASAEVESALNLVCFPGFHLEDIATTPNEDGCPAHTFTLPGTFRVPQSLQQTMTSPACNVCLHASNLGSAGHEV